MTRIRGERVEIWHDTPEAEYSAVFYVYYEDTQTLFEMEELTLAGHPISTALVHDVLLNRLYEMAEEDYYDR